MPVSINEYYGTRKVEPPLQNAYDVDFCKHYIFHSVDSFHLEIGNNNGIWRKSTLDVCNTSYYRLKVFKQLFADKKNNANWIQC